MKSLENKRTVTREYLSGAIKNATGITLKRSSDIVSQILDTMTYAIKDGRIIKIRMFGTFSTKIKNPRIGRNPKTMEESVISKRIVVKLKAAPTLRKMINQNINMISNDA